MGRGGLQRPPRPLHRRRGRLHLGLQGPHGEEVHPRRRAYPHVGYQGSAGRGGGALQQAHGRGDSPRRRDVRLGRLRERQGPQVLEGRRAAPLVGGARLRAGPVRHSPRRLGSSGWTSVCRGQAEPQDTDIHAGRGVRDGVDRPPPALQRLHRRGAGIHT